MRSRPPPMNNNGTFDFRNSDQRVGLLAARPHAGPQIVDRDDREFGDAGTSKPQTQPVPVRPLGILSQC